MHAKFQLSSFTAVGGEYGERWTRMGRQAFLNRSLCKISKLFPCFALDE